MFWDFCLEIVIPHPIPQPAIIWVVYDRRAGLAVKGTCTDST
jgi:hypothetical protein